MKALNVLAVFVFALFFSGPLLSADKGYLEDGETEVELTRISYAVPIYPRKALRLEIQGTVRVEFDVDKDGSVLDPFVVEGNPPGVFDRSAIKAVRKILYEPPTHNGTPVKVNNVQIDLTFKLS